MRQKNKEGKRRTVQRESTLLELKNVAVAILFTFTFFLSSVSAQESVNVTGGTASGSGGSTNYSVGQVVYTTNTSTNGSVAQGVQQPFEISVVTATEEAKGINLSVTAYPNPTTDYLQLKVESEKPKDFSYQLYDMTGKLLQNKKMTGTEAQIDMSSYVPATYFIRVVADSKTIKEFKIIKN